MLVRTSRACLGWGPVSRSGSGMAIAWLMRKAKVKEEHRRGKAWEEASGQQHFQKYSVLCNRESSVTGVYYKWSDILKSMTK